MKIRITTCHGTEELTGKELVDCCLGGLVMLAIVLTACYFPNIFA